LGRLNNKAPGHLKKKKNQIKKNFLQKIMEKYFFVPSFQTGNNALIHWLYYGSYDKW